MNGIKNTSCPICLKNLLQITLVPCGHMTCIDCSNKIKKCHYCDIIINNKIKNWVSYNETQNQYTQTDNLNKQNIILNNNILTFNLNNNLSNDLNNNDLNKTNLNKKSKLISLFKCKFNFFN